MKKPVLLLLALVTVLATGCPIGLEYPLGQPGTEKIDKGLVGTWQCDAEDPEVKRVTIKANGENSYAVHVLERGSMYSLETDNLEGWVTKVGDGSFIFLRPEGETNYYHYQYWLDGGDLVTTDVALLDGGVDAVTSTESLRAQVEASMKMEEWGKEVLTWGKE